MEKGIRYGINPSKRVLHQETLEKQKRRNCRENRASALSHCGWMGLPVCRIALRIRPSFTRLRRMMGMCTATAERLWFQWA